MWFILSLHLLFYSPWPNFHCCRTRHMFLLSLVYFGPFRLPYIPCSLEPDHQRRREYRLGTVGLNCTEVLGFWERKKKKRNRVISTAKLDSFGSSVCEICILKSVDSPCSRKPPWQRAKYKGCCHVGFIKIGKHETFTLIPIYRTLTPGTFRNAQQCHAKSDTIELNLI